jgi:ribosomal protein S18 acetylase RimI-like enzyme
MSEFRSAKENDHAILVKLYLDEVEPNKERADQFAYDLIHKMNTILCLEEAILCGTISWNVRGGKEDGVIEIVSLGVNKHHRRRGLATDLMQKAMKEAQDFLKKAGSNLRTVFLLMESSNETARSFYKAVHFEEVVAIPSFYPHDGASIFVRILEGA